MKMRLFPVQIWMAIKCSTNNYAWYIYTSLHYALYEYKEMDFKCAKSEMCQIKSLNIGVQTSWRL